MIAFALGSGMQNCNSSALKKSTVGEVYGEAEVDGIEVDCCARIVDEVADAGQFSQFGIKLDCCINIINYVTNAHYSDRSFLRWFV